MESNQIASTLSIFPNPAAEVISLQTGTIFQQGKVNVYDMVGRLVYSIENMTGETLQLNLKDLPEGMYLIEVLEDNRIWNGKAVIKT